MDISKGGYVNFFNNSKGHVVQFVRQGNSAVQLNADGTKVLGKFTLDGNTWTNASGKRSFSTNDSNGSIASGISNGGTIDGGQKDYFRMTGYGLNSQSIADYGDLLA